MRVGELYRESLKENIKNRINEHTSVFLLSYSKLSSVQASELRKDLKQAGASVFVSKNSLARIALKEIEQEPLAEKIEGQTAFVWTSDDSVAVSKILVKYSKESEIFNVKAGLMEERLLDETKIKELSELPSKEQLLAQLLGTIQAPLTRLAGALNAKSRELLSILRQLSEKKGGNE